MDLALVLVWTLKIVLPIVIFCIYFKLQSPKDEQYSGASKNQISRGRILARRKASLDGAVVPEALKTITLKDQTEAPSLFTAPATRPARGGGGGGGGGRREERPRGERREKREPREPREPRDAKEPREPKAKAERDTKEPEAEAVADEPLGPEEEKQHLESLLNYVAFNRKEQQRTFLLDEETAPPPPPPKPRKPPPAPGPPAAPVAAAEVASDGADKTGEDATKKANADAQLVLRGAINFKRADVARDIYDKLSEQSVEISERTFTLMIEASVLARDLKSASDFLMKMETSGFCPDSEILDKVMDLYAQQKHQKEQAKKDAPRPLEEAGNTFGVQAGDAAQASGDECYDGPRVKLSSDARIFVPSFGMPPPPPPPGPPASEAQAVDTEQMRTKLTAAAKPFEPQFNYTFDSCTYTWTSGDEWNDDAAAETRGKGGNKRPSKGSGKGDNGKSENGDRKAGGGKAKKEKDKDRDKAKAEAANKDDAAEQEKSKSNKENREAKKPARSWKPKQSSEAEPE